MPDRRALAPLIALGWMVGGLAHAATIVVPDERPTIHEAVASAAAGDTIKVRPGTYAESVLVAGAAKSRLTLEGLEGRPVVSPPVGQEGIRVDGASAVTIRGLDVKGGTIGVHVVDSAESVVTDVHVTGSGEGIRIRRCRSQCDVSRNRVEGTTRGPGIRVRDSPAANLNANVVVGSRRDGIRVAKSAGISFGDNRVERSGADGIRISDCEGVDELEGNVATANRGSGLRLDHGFVDGSCPACGVQDNRTEGNARYGLRVRRWAHISTPADLRALENVSSGNRNADFRVRP